MENSPDEKPLQTTSFIVHATLGVIRDRSTRRRIMFILLASALALLVFGSTLLQSLLAPSEHPVWFILFWILCGWLAFTAMLLAAFDILVVKRNQRNAERHLRQKLADKNEAGV